MSARVTRRNARGQQITSVVSQKRNLSVVGRACDPSPHLRVSVGEEVVETLDPDESEARVFHVGDNVEGDCQGASEQHHVYYAAPCRCCHPEASQL
jgi:hypothetical protein